MSAVFLLSYRVGAEIEGSPRSASDTVFFEKPTASAMTRMVTGGMGCPHWSRIGFTVKRGGKVGPVFDWPGPVTDRPYFTPTRSTVTEFAGNVTSNLPLTGVNGVVCGANRIGSLKVLSI